MQTRKLLLTLVLISLASGARSQVNILRVEQQFGTFSMADLKDLQDRLIPDLDVNVRKISSFPPYAGYGLSYLTSLKNGMGIGITSEFFSTGARNGYEDYSGYYKFDILAHCFNIGTVISIVNELDDGQWLNFEVSQGLKLSSLTIRERLFVTEPVSDEKAGFKSLGWWVKAGLRYEYDFLDYFTAGAFIGGEFNIPSKLESKDRANVFIFKDNGKYAKINWSGIRAGLSIAIDMSVLSSGKKKTTGGPQVGLY